MKKRNRTEVYVKGLYTQIRGLKAEIHDQYYVIKDLRRRIEEKEQNSRGELIVTWEPFKATQQCNGLNLSKFNPGDQIATIGKVKHVQAWVEDGCDNLHSQITYEVFEIRKIGT